MNDAHGPQGTMSAEATAQMAMLVEQRHAVLAEILRLAERQEAAIEAGMVQPLMAALNDKQAQVDRLREIQHALKPMADVPPENRRWAGPASRQKCRDTLSASAALQAEILAIDQRCEQAMIQRRDELFDSLGKTTGAAAAARAYATGGAVPQSKTHPAPGGSLDLASG